jgi:hypothetical protein
MLAASSTEVGATIDRWPWRLGSPRPMLGRMNGKLIGAFCGGAFIGQLVARVLFDWILDVGGTAQTLLIVGSALALAVIFLIAQMDEERRDDASHGRP